MVIQFVLKGNKAYFHRTYPIMRNRYLLINNPQGKKGHELRFIFYASSNRIKNFRKVMKEYKAQFLRIRNHPILKLKEI